MPPGVSARCKLLHRAEGYGGGRQAALPPSTEVVASGARFFMIEPYAHFTKELRRHR
jgi:hypothetical protein